MLLQQAWTYSQGMQEQGTGTTPKGENIITLEDMEEKGSTVRKNVAQHNVQAQQTQKELKV